MNQKNWIFKESVVAIVHLPIVSVFTLISNWDTWHKTMILDTATVIFGHNRLFGALNRLGAALPR